MIISVLLVVAGFAGTMVAFGGETWTKGPEAILSRITNRGWLSLTFAVIALGLGVAEKVQSNDKEAAVRVETQADEKLLRDKLDNQGILLRDEKARSLFLQQQAISANAQLANSAIALAADQKVVDGVAKVEKEINHQVDLANKEIAVEGQSLEKSQQVLDAMSAVQTQVRDFSLLTALSKNQSQLDIEVRIPILPIVFHGAKTPTTLVDLVFPRWKEDGIQDENQLLLAFEVESASRNSGQGLNGSLWGFRNDPYKINTLGSAEIVTDPLKEGLETRLEMYGDASVAHVDGRDLLISNFRFPKAQIPGQWLSEFKLGTKFFTTSFIVRDDITEERSKALIDFWNKMFLPNASFQIPLLDQRNFFMEYELKRSDPLMTKAGNLKIISVSYFVSSSPLFKTRDM